MSRRPGSFDLQQLLRATLHAVPETRTTLAAIIKLLDGHDRSHGTELVRTLRAYVEADRSVSRAAEMLGVHRHTVLNRLRHAERVLGRSLRRGIDRYVVELAFIAYDTGDERSR